MTFQRIVVGAFAVALALSSPLVALAAHDKACMAMSNVALPSPPAPPGTPSLQAACLAVLPAPPPLSVSGVAFSSGGTEINAGRSGVLFVRGTNVAAPGIRATGDGGGFDANISVPRLDLDPTCVGRGCLTLTLTTQSSAARRSRCTR